LWPSVDADKRVDSLFAEAGWKKNDLKIIVHAAASLPAKQWPLERFAEVMKILKQKYKARFVYTGAQGDATLYNEIEGMGPFDGLNLCGITNLRENISVYRAANLFFGVDSGPMHIAAAVNVSVVALFGPTDERKWGPWGAGHTVITKRMSCSPCKPHKCKNNECMKKITAAEVLETFEKKIREITSGNQA
jgi:ADP-heptose:LPS heptosyltransferase